MIRCAPLGAEIGIADEIALMAGQGKKASEIAEQLGCSIQYVWRVLSAGR